MKINSRLLKICTLISTVLLVGIPILIAPDLLLKDNFVLSVFGVDSRTSLIFNLGVICASIFLFLVLYKLRISVLKDYKRSLFFLISILLSLGLLVLGLVPYSVNVTIHWAGAIIFFLMILVLILAEIFFVKSKRLLIALAIILIIATVLVFNLTMSRGAFEVLGIASLLIYLFLLS